MLQMQTLLLFQKTGALVKVNILIDSDKFRLSATLSHHLHMEPRKATPVNTKWIHYIQHPLKFL